MQSIVTAIDDPHASDIAQIWGELKAVFGLTTLTGDLRPHLTFAVAEHYDPAVESTLAGIAARGTPFRIETHGIGVTEGQQTLIYLHVTRTEILDDVHHVIHHATQPLARNPRPAYASDTWLPHIAVATAPIPPDQIQPVMDFLRRRDYAWTIPATNLCLNPNTQHPDAEWLRFDLKGVAATAHP